MIRLVLALVLLSAVPAIGQTVITTGPLPANSRIEWTLPANLTLADAPTFEVRLRDGAFIPVTALTNVTCTAGTPVVCAAPVTASNADALNRVGVHNLTLSYFRADVGDSAVSAPFVLRSPAGAPSKVQVTTSGI
jgi:hypothetical protein